MGSFANGDKQVYSLRVGTQMSIVNGKKNTKIQVSIGFKVPVVFAVCFFVFAFAVFTFNAVFWTLYLAPAVSDRWFTSR